MCIRNVYIQIPGTAKVVIVLLKKKTFVYIYIDFFLNVLC